MRDNGFTPYLHHSADKDIVSTGFTLIEIILVVVVIGIASLGLTAVMQQVLANSYYSEALSTATSLAVGEAERLTGLSFVSVSAENREPYTGALSAYSREVRVDSIDTAQPNLGSDPAMQNYKVVEVRVYHSAVNYVSIKFLRANYSL